MNAPTFMDRHDADPHRSPPDGRVRVSASKASTRNEPRSGNAALDIAHCRLISVAALFALCFSVIGGRLIDLAATKPEAGPRTADSWPAVVRARADITDRNGVVLATDLAVASLYAEPRLVQDPARSAAALAAVLPGVPQAELRAKLESGRTFVWLKRHLTPKEQADVNRLGLPGIGFQQEQRRLYPLGALAAHVVGFSDIDNKGIAGVEQFFDNALRAFPQSGLVAPLKLGLDTRVQFAVREELLRALVDFNAKGAAGIVMNAHTGEIVAMVSVPDFDPNRAGEAAADSRFNRATLGVFEPGSTMKVMTVAMALDYGTARLDERFDATKPLHVSRFIIHDDHAKNRWLTVPEVFVYSSNIGAARMAMEVGGERQRAFLHKLGMLERPPVELPEAGAPLVPEVWREINTITIAFGHGIAMSPLQYAAGFAAVINGGFKVTPTLLAGGRPGARERVVSHDTSDIMRRLLRLNVEQGTGRQADSLGYLVGGKTGTAEKAVAGGYKKNALVSSFAAAFPMTDPQYVVLVLLDEPTGTASTQGFATGGWTAAPIVSRIVARAGPILGVSPVDDKSTDVRRALYVSLDGRRLPSAAF
jgi:cell division protein FtsI (penicillin-binding protein 3)